MTNWGKFSRIVAEAKAAKKLDPVGHEDDDVDNDGDSDSSDSYLKKRRATVGAAIAADRKNKVQEELIGNQKEIDANDNGKVDAGDFKLLRAKKKVKKEEVEQIDEVLGGQSGDGYIGHPRLGIKNPLSGPKKPTTTAPQNTGLAGRLGNRASQMDAAMKELRQSYEPEGEQLNELPIVPIAIGAGALAAPYLAKRFLKPAADKALDKATNDPNRRLVTGGTVGDLNKAKGLSNSYQPEGEVLDERRRAEKGTPRKPRDKAFELVANSMGSGRFGVQPRGEKKDRGGPTPGPSMTPTQKVEKRRADAQRAQDMMHSARD